MPDAFSRAARQIVDTFRAQRPLRAGSLVVTLFGDAIAPRGCEVWLGSLIEVLEPFGLNDRLVRTSVHRLAQNDWLEARKVGRRSYYTLTEPGHSHFNRATQRIYGQAQPDAWDGRWTLVALTGLDAAYRDKLRKELGWLGFGALTRELLAHPICDITTVDTLLGELAARDEVLVFSARSENVSSPASLAALTRRCWKLDEVAMRYGGFLLQFEPLRTALSHSPEIPHREGFVIRTLLLHEYRKVILRDPRLPTELLPEDWPGPRAYRLCRGLYTALLGPSERYLESRLQTSDGPVPGPTPPFYERFGGLPNTIDE